MFRISSGVAKAAFVKGSIMLGRGMSVGSSPSQTFSRLTSPIAPGTSNIGQVAGKNSLAFGAVQPIAQLSLQRPISDQISNDSVDFEHPHIQMAVLEKLISGQKINQRVIDGIQNCNARLWVYGDQEKIKEQLLELLLQQPLTSNAAMTLRFLNDLLEDDQNSLATALLRENSSYIHVESAALKTVLGSLHIFDNPEVKARLIESATAELDKESPDPEMLDVIMQNVDDLIDNPRAQRAVAWTIWEGGVGDDRIQFAAVGKQFTDQKARLIIAKALEIESFHMSNLDAIRARQSLRQLLG